MVPHRTYEEFLNVDSERAVTSLASDSDREEQEGASENENAFNAPGDTRNPRKRPSPTALSTSGRKMRRLGTQDAVV